MLVAARRARAVIDRSNTWIERYLCVGVGRRLPISQSPSKDSYKSSVIFIVSEVNSQLETGQRA
jgi:hypothetical protein